MKLEKIEKAFKDKPIAKEVAYMIATSHEYKKPNEDAAIKLVSNYTWSLGTQKVSNLQGINKPVDKEKVFNIAKTLNPKKMSPLMVVDKFQGITPQTKGKKILLDGHHRKEALEFKGIKETPVYIGRYNAGAEKSIKELIDKKADELLYGFNKTASKRGKPFKFYEKNKVELSKEEKAIARKEKATWPSGEIAVWKAIDPKTGEVTYVTHTHRAFNIAPTLKEIISRFHSFIKKTAESDEQVLIEKKANEILRDIF